MSESTPWFLGNDPGHVRAVVADADRMSKIISRARRILTVLGPEISDDGAMLSVVRAIPSSSLVASPRTRPLMAVASGVKPDVYMNVLEVMDRLRDPDWQGFDGKGAYDLVIFLGMDYYYASQMFSLMKHFGRGVGTVSLGRHYQPNARYSFSNLVPATWHAQMQRLAGLLRGEE